MKKGPRYSTKDREPVNKKKYGGYEEAPDYYYNLEFVCKDCGIKVKWTAKEQKIWHEQIREKPYAISVRCKKCRTHNQALKDEQKRHMVEQSKKKPHPNEKFFKKKI